MRHFNFLIGLALLSAIGAARAAEGRERYLEHVFLTAGEPSGRQTAYYAADGTITISFSFNDRGRGPETRTILRLNEFGVPVAMNISGVNYQKATIDERFALMRGKAVWKSKLEHDQADFEGTAFYLAHNAPPELTAIMARAALEREGGLLRLLPSGRAQIRRLNSETLDGPRGETTISLYALTGLGPDPQYVWLDERRDFFGVDFSWFAIIRKGFAEHLPVLKAAQTAARDAHFEALSRKLTRTIDGPLAIRGARLFDSEKGRLTKERTVVIENGRISAVEKAGFNPPADAEVIDAEGMLLLPALWDMHGHVSPARYFNYLAAGVTNVRDMANDPDFIVKTRADIAAGRIAGPDIHPMGFIDKIGPYAAPTGILAESLEDALRFVDYYTERGFLGIKLYSSIEPEWVPAIARHAHAKGLSVLGHIPSGMTAEEAVLAGFDEITHVNMILLNFLGAAEIDTRTPQRFLVPGEKAGGIDLESKEVRDFIRLLRERDIAHDPTLSIFMDMFRNRPGEITPIFSAIADHLPASVRRDMINGTGFNEGREEAFAAAADTTLELIRLLHEAGVRLLPGTDNALPGFTLLRELEYYVEAGIPAAAALQSATIEPALHMGLEDRLGSIAPGKLAHLVLVEGDPTADISALYRSRLVIKGDRMYRPGDILTTLGFVPFE